MSPFRFLFCVLLFLVGSGVSFIIPFVREGAGDRSAFVFGIYFGAMVVASLLTYRWGALRRWRWGVPVSSLLYFVSFVMMAELPAPGGLIAGRAIEGIAVGMRMPLLFRDAMTAEAKARDRMVVAMNSLFALGYVTGPFLADLALLRLSPRVALLGFGALSLVLSVAMELARPGQLGLEHAPADEKPPTADRFLLLFIAKFFYGFLLTTITAPNGPRLFSNNVSIVFLVLAGIYVSGQVLGARLVKTYSTEALGLALSSILAVLAIALATWPGTTTLLAAALAQAVLFFVGFRAIGSKPSDSKTYALFSALSDPGSMLGAVAGRFGATGALGVAIVAALPALRRATAAKANRQAGAS